ncbi:hypothetical protein I8751_28380 [Nostocaceae cyanobacterium CENA357]|uniref:Uncharacterized protein n=1 Tax=Atlanticothrix silvestris CENA357 TaxID=1725252 RepID=A0A8J7L5T1_9CYAN|nr:hypothetical protein [Atlanticothrix silvestris]MBH8556181.1 hypothetical protein [Atlanticothrix silvestris CENA357]
MENRHQGSPGGAEEAGEAGEAGKVLFIFDVGWEKGKDLKLPFVFVLSLLSSLTFAQVCPSVVAALP